MKESFGSDLKKEISNQVMNIDSFNVDAIESVKTMNKLTNSISEEDDEDDDDTNSETTEATSAGGGSGQYSEPLFSTTKREMEKGGSKLNKVEATEATSSASSGQYSTPAFVAKDSKNWRGNKKPQIPGGKFVKIKDKCRKFPYCNQGDINALKIFSRDYLFYSSTSEDHNEHNGRARNATYSFESMIHRLLPLRHEAHRSVMCVDGDVSIYEHCLHKLDFYFETLTT